MLYACFLNGVSKAPFMLLSVNGRMIPPFTQYRYREGF